MRLREEVKYIGRVTSSPFHKLKARHPRLLPLAWSDAYCVSILYYWVAFVIDQSMPKDIADADKRYVLLKTFASGISATGGDSNDAIKRVCYDESAIRRMVLVDLNKVASLYLSLRRSGYMIDPDYRAASGEHGRLSALSTDDTRVTESDFEIFLGRCIGRRMKVVLAMNVDRGRVSGT